MQLLQRVLHRQIMRSSLSALYQREACKHSNSFPEVAGHAKYNESLSLLQPSKLFHNKVSTKNGTFSGSGNFTYLRSAAVQFSPSSCVHNLPAHRCMSTAVNPIPTSQESSDTEIQYPSRIKFKRLDKTARHIMNILDKEAVGQVQAERAVPDIQPGCIVQLKVEVPENKRRVTTMKGIVIARRNSGLSTTFRLRRVVGGVGIENVFPLYSPNIKEIKILDKKKVRRAKLYYLRDRMNALKK